MADKKLLEESTIRRFMELANIKPSEKGMLSEAVQAGGARHQAGLTTDESESRLGNMGTRGAGRVAEKKHMNKGDKDDLEETVDEEKMEEAYHEEGYDMNEADEEGGEDSGMDMAGDEMGASGEGGDLESAVQGLVSAMNDVLAAAGMSDKTVELDSGEGEEGGEAEEMGGEDEAAMMEANDKMEEELEESIELVDDTLVEKLLQRVSARLVAEARKSRELAENKKGWTNTPSKSASHKKSTVGKGAGKKQGAPFNKPVSGVKGLAGRGR